MNIPQAIKIGGHIFEIKIVKETSGWDKAASLDGKNNVIWLNPDYNISKQKSNLIHEILHEISWQNDLELNESQISTLAENMFQIFNENGMLK